MKTKLDSESLGIITMNCFMEEFFPGESSREMPPSFTFYHYNGLPRSNPQKKVCLTIIMTQMIYSHLNLIDA